MRKRFTMLPEHPGASGHVIFSLQSFPCPIWSLWCSQINLILCNSVKYMKAALWNYYAINYKAFTLSMTSYWLKAIRMSVCVYVHAQGFVCVWVWPVKSNRSRRTNSLRKRCLACLNPHICSRTSTARSLLLVFPNARIVAVMVTGREAANEHK